MGLGALAQRAVNVNVTTTDSTGGVLSSDVYTITDGLIPSWDGTPYRGAMNTPGFWRAAVIAADLLGSLPWEAYDRNPGAVPTIAQDQPAVLDKPAPPDERITTVSSWGLDYLWHGNAVALKGRLTPDGDVSVLAPVPIGNVAIGRSNGDDGTGLRRGSPVYRIGNSLRRPDEVIHIKGPCEPGALRGLGALELHLQGGIRNATELQRQAGLLDIAGVPTGTLKTTAPDLTDDEIRIIKNRWLAAQRERSVAVLNDVTEFTPLAWNPTESQLLEARKYSLHEAALIIGVPLYFLGVDTSNRTYSNVEQEGIVLTRFHMAGAIRRIEAAFTSCMRTGRFVEADLSDALRADTLTRFQAWQIGVTAGFLTPNEVRGRERLAPVPGGDELAPPPTQTTQGDPAKPDTGPPEIAEGEREQGRSAVLVEGLEELAAIGMTPLELEDILHRADPRGANLHQYWTVGPGRARWSTWTELYNHLVKYLSPNRARRTAAEWFHDVKGYWPGDRRNRSAVLRGRHSFDPDQPRYPAGTPNAGQWVGQAGTGGPLAPSPSGTSVAALLAANSGGSVTAGPRGRYRPRPGEDGPLAPAPAARPTGTDGSPLPRYVQMASDGGDGDEPSAGARPGDVIGTDARGRPIVVGRQGGYGVAHPEVTLPKGYGGGEGTGLKRYKLNTDKYCPTCGGKAQDPQWSDSGVMDYAPDGTPLFEVGTEPERDDEPYHDKSDPDYQEDP